MELTTLMITMEAIIAEKKTIQRILGGEVASFSEIVERHHLKVRSYISSRCNNSSDTEDITQEIFIAAYHNLSQYDTEKPFSAWLFGIARNKSNEYFRKIKRVPIPIDLDEIPESSHSGSPDLLIALDEKSKCFWNEAKRILTEEQFSAIWLKYQSDLSVLEISEALDVSESNAKIHLFRARKKLVTSTIINQLSS